MKVIKDKFELLLFFCHRTAEKWDIPNIQIRVSPPASKIRSELCVEWQRKKQCFQICPELYPSRSRLNSFKIVRNYLDVLTIHVCPHIPPKLAEDYRKAGINHADLNGRLFIQSEGLILDREPKEKLYTNPLSDPDLFSLKAGRISRALLAHRNDTWTHEKLAEHTKVSTGLVSKILKSLINNTYVEKLSDFNRKGGTPATYRLKNFDALLDAWKAADQWHKRVTIHQYSLLTDDIFEIAKTVRDALGDVDVAFTQWFAAHLRHPYTTPPLVSAYVTPSHIEIFGARKVDSGGNLWLIVPNDEGIFYETQIVDGFRLVSDVQIYLDLLQVGQRGPDQAEELRKWDNFAR